MSAGTRVVIVKTWRGRFSFCPELPGRPGARSASVANHVYRDAFEVLP